MLTPLDIDKHRLYLQSTSGQFEKMAARFPPNQPMVLILLSQNPHRKARYQFEQTSSICQFDLVMAKRGRCHLERIHMDRGSDMGVITYLLASFVVERSSRTAQMKVETPPPRQPLP